MTRRPGDWHLVGHDRDPVPGSRYDVDRVATSYRTRATDLGDAHDTLRTLSELDGWRGEAAEAFAETADDSLGDLAKARDKYGRAATALERYADAVETARDDTLRALQAAEEAEERRRRNDVDTLEGVSEPTSAQRDAQRDHDRLAGEAAGDVRAAAADLERALGALEDAARSCADEIKEASESMEDGWFDDFKGWVRDNIGPIKILLKILEVLAIALAVLAIIFGGWVIFLIAVAVALAIVAINAMMYAAGEATLGDVLMSLAALALTLVGGRLALKLAAAVKGAFKPAMLAAVASTKANAKAGPFAQFLLRQSKFNPMRWAGAVVAPISRSTRANLGALSLRWNVFTTRAGFMSSLKMADRASANYIAKLGKLDDLGFDVSAQLAQVNALRGAFNKNALLTLGYFIGDSSVAKLTDLANHLRGSDAGGISPSTLAADGIDEALSDLAEFSWRVQTTN